MTKTEKSPFTPYLPRERKQQTFDIHEKTKQYGKEVEWYQLIQEAREDTEIYPTLEKYGCLDKIMVHPNKMMTDFTEFKDLRSMKDQQIKAKEMWESLPYDIRMDFNNNVNEFIEKGEEYIAKKYKEELTPTIEQPQHRTKTDRNEDNEPD